MSRKEEEIKQAFYGWDNEKDTLRQIQKCQRNWDHSHTIHPEAIDYLLWTAENSPSKQNEGYFDLYWTADRKVLDELSDYTWGTTHSRNPPSTWRNSQMNASLYILWVGKEPWTQLNCNADGTLKENYKAARWENAYVSIGISLGLTMRAAAKMGYHTGANKSHGDLNGNDFWENRLGILDDVKKGTKKIAYGLGVGRPQEGRPRWESDQTELAIGAGNGSNLATDLSLKKHPWKDKNHRHIKIIDITKDAGKTIKDPYGRDHKIPEKCEIKINTIRERKQNIFEIK